MISKTFPDELRAANVSLEGYSWSSDGTLRFNSSVTQETRDAVQAVLSAHDPSVIPTRQVGKSLIISRLTDQQLDDALGLMNNRQKERWRAPDHPVIDTDDPELLTVLGAIGANSTAVLAPPE